MSIIEKALAKQQSKAPEVKPSTPNVSNEPVIEPPNTPMSIEENSLKVKESLTLDKQSLEERGYLIDNGTRKSIKDEFRQIKRKLLNNAFGSSAKTLHHSNLIMVSSAKPNEGKTFVAINLALSIALEQDKTVLLIDADVLRPSVIRELGVKETSGIIEYLLGEAEQVSDVIYNTDIDKLKLIPAGKPHHLSNELLASEKMAALAGELANRYPDRIVIFDCPPLIGVTETLVLANLMGQAVIVVEESKTSLADIKSATENLNEDLALGLVLNKAIRSHKDLYGYYGYGYGAKE
ncbi:MAG: XrtA-associated tyrosine autokinase [Colwellia sp.]